MITKPETVARRVLAAAIAKVKCLSQTAAQGDRGWKEEREELHGIAKGVGVTEVRDRRDQY